MKSHTKNLHVGPQPGLFQVFVDLIETSIKSDLIPV